MLPGRTDCERHPPYLHHSARLNSPSHFHASHTIYTTTIPLRASTSFISLSFSFSSSPSFPLLPYFFSPSAFFISLSLSLFLLPPSFSFSLHLRYFTARVFILFAVLLTIHRPHSRTLTSAGRSPPSSNSNYVCVHADSHIHTSFRSIVSKLQHFCAFILLEPFLPCSLSFSPLLHPLSTFLIHPARSPLLALSFSESRRLYPVPFISFFRVLHGPVTHADSPGQAIMADHTHILTSPPLHTHFCPPSGIKLAQLPTISLFFSLCRAHSTNQLYLFNHHPPSAQFSFAFTSNSNSNSTTSLNSARLLASVTSRRLPPRPHNDCLNV